MTSHTLTIDQEKCDRQRKRSLARLRCAYFAEAADCARRYHVSFDRLLLQLWDARHAHPRMKLKQIKHVADLTLAAACVDGVGAAWVDLMEQHEHALIRRCKGVEDTARAAMHVRHMLARLRRHSTELRSQSLRTYHGIKPLRYWLLDCLRAQPPEQRPHLELGQRFALQAHV